LVLQLLSQLQVGLVSLLHLLALLVVVDGQLLQRLQHLLHLLLGQLVLRLQPAKLLLDLLVVIIFSPFLQRLSSASSLWMMFFRLLFLSFSFSYFFFHSSAVSSRFTDTVYLCPNMSVDLVSASL
uniref:Uncharacterized protein n=1 Tax=Amphiprion percula TaxID=161767 RepID=A0A3P8U231_AMPPE